MCHWRRTAMYGKIKLLNLLNVAASHSINIKSVNIESVISMVGIVLLVFIFKFIWLLPPKDFFLSVLRSDVQMHNIVTWQLQDVRQTQRRAQLKPPRVWELIWKSQHVCVTERATSGRDLELWEMNGHQLSNFSQPVYLELVTLTCVFEWLKPCDLF